MSLYTSVRPLLFRLPAETAHDLGKGALRAAQATGPTRSALRRRYQYRHPALEVDLFGTTFPTPIGVAAGFDKNGEVSHALAALGFGSVEIGTVTPYPQAGNPRPRLFRLPEDGAMINRMGFNGHGAERVAKRLETRGLPEIPVGINVGKMNTSGPREAIEDYRRAFDRLSQFGEYFVVNVSCPNTPEEYDEQHPDHLREIFGTLADENHENTPLLVKVGPDADEDSLADLVEIVHEFDVDGIVATNTTTSRDGVSSPARHEWGGLSGDPLESRATDAVRTVAELTDLPIIGVGGVRDAEDAYRKIRAGASLVQLYTGFVYEGPSIARQISTGLVERLERDGFDSVSEAVGADLE